MTAVLKIFLSMSFSGSLLILALLLGKRFWKNKISRQWQYYIWLIVIIRLLLPFGPEASLMGRAYQAIDQGMTQAASLPQWKNPSGTPDVLPVSDMGQGGGETVHPPSVSPPADDLWLVWAAAALVFLIRKATIYQSFTRYINAGLTPVSDIALLDRLSVIAEQRGVKRPVELGVHPMVSSPLLIGLFHPCIVLPGADIPEKDFQYIVWHELTHYKRRDMLYQWLAQVTVCLHWFNPLVHLMRREITEACEFSCDEAVLSKMGCGSAEDYGKTLLDAMAAVGKYRESPGAVTLSENKQLLKERLGAIMNFKRKSRTIRILTGVLTLCIIFGASFVGIYPVAAAKDTPKEPGKDIGHQEQDRTTGLSSSEAERYYEADSLPLFQIAFSRLDKEEQSAWLEKLYADSDFAFFSVAVRSLDEDNPLIAVFAEKAYTDGEIAFFSTLTDCMDETDLEPWLDRALEDGRWNFQSMLFDKLNMNDEKDAKEKEWAEQQLAEYRAVGVTHDGKNYYYQGQLVNIFLDIRPNKSFYTLDLNPAGTVNIKMIRGEDGQLTGAACMTEAEVTGLLDDMIDPNDD